jgi:cytochrome P450
MQASPGMPNERPVFDPFDPRWSSDPYPLYAELRQRAPVHRNEMGFWVFARHADCLALLRDRRVSSDGSNIDLDRMPGGFRPQLADDPVASAMVAMRPFLFRDPPDHTRLRGLVAKAFTPRVVESLRARTHEVVDELLDAALEAGEVDLLESFAHPLPVRIICDLLGVPIDDQERFRGWSAALARGLDPDFLLTKEIIDQRIDAVGQFGGYFFELLAERRKTPGDDLLSRLVLVEEEGSVLNEAELLSTCILLLVAGHETTVNLIAGGTLALLEHPDQLQHFRTDPDVVRSGIEEMLRFVSPVQLTGRSLLEDLDVGGVTLQKGDFAMLLVASANHDPDEFEEPEAFDVGRSPNNHLGFGFGIHHCLGAPLARMEAQVALTSLTRRAPDLALVGGQDGNGGSTVTYKTNVVLRGMEALPVSMRG